MPLCLGMASERMMQAIGTLERAIDRLEQEADRAVADAASSTDRPINIPAARAALHSLDNLIEELKGKAHG